VRRLPLLACGFAVLLGSVPRRAARLRAPPARRSGRVPPQCVAGPARRRRHRQEGASCQHSRPRRLRGLPGRAAAAGSRGFVRRHRRWLGRHVGPASPARRGAQA
jgi:hypothetical protein